MNLLSQETSPYLRQHQDNPVHWRGWSPAALAEARETDRPILLSVGYAACHWCHVMAHESFEDGEVAAVMNRLYVNIKVDREERPDIDQIYMAALAATGEQGGWPLTMFLTPDGKPFWGGTYFPRQPRYGRPGFIQVLESVHRAWVDKRADLGRSADALSDHVRVRLASDGIPAKIERGQLLSLAEGIRGMIDAERGGLRGAPKFPNAPFMQTLWLAWLAEGRADCRDAALLSLRRMLDGGIYDHVGGGLSRYSTDAEWLVPHFEKMLYDNAQLIRMANWAYGETGDRLFQVRIEDTIDWLMREMRLPSGAFASSLDADSEGEEGLFYTWSEAEVRAVLGNAASAFLSAYSLTAPPGWHGKPILHRNAASTPTPAGSRNELAALLAARNSRTRPGLDDKVLVDWNGMLIVALAEAGRAMARPDWLDAAAAAYRFVVESVDAAGRLPHSILGDRRLYPAMSSDHAAMATAAVALFEATGNQRYLADGKDFLSMLDRWYRDEGDGHWLTAQDSGDVPVRIRGDVDEATPSATAQIIEAFVRVATATGDTDLALRAQAIAEAATGRIAGQAYGQAGIVNACALATEPLKLVMVDRPDSSEFATVAARLPDPRRVDIPVRLGGEGTRMPGDALPDTSQPGAWYCSGSICLPPVRDAASLERLLRRMPA